MKKLIRLVEVRLVKTSPTEDGLQFSFVDYEPDKEMVNPLKDKFNEMKRSLEDKGRKLPPDIEGLIDVFGEMPQGLVSGPPQAYFSSTFFFVTKAQYEALGRPMVGDVLSIELMKLSVEDILEKEPPLKVTCPKCNSTFYARVFPVVCPTCDTKIEKPA